VDHSIKLRITLFPST